VPHSAQWERYYAPTLYDGKAYVDGGYYGGMYGFDAYSGAQEWFTDLPQYDQWTPAISGDLAHSYVGEYSPGLYSVDRNTGRLVSVIPDPNFEWNGWSMDMAPVVGGNGDVFAIHDGRLISFDVSLRAIRWELQRSFVGQPSEALGKIYAIDGGRLVALDEATGNELWSWQPPEAPVGPMIVTNTHILVSTATSVHAVSLETRDSVWSYPVAGYLALADGNLYVASADGTLTAIAMPSSAAADLEGLEIVGPTEVVESFSAQYRAFAHYSDGQVQERTFSSTWSVEPGTYARIDTHGVLTTAELIRPAEDLLIRAHYEEGGRSSDGALNVHLVAGVSLTDLIIRNLVESLEIKEGILRDIDAALERERAARALRSSAALRIAINREVVARRQVVNSMKLLNVILKKLGYVAPPVASATREGAATDQSGER
jgi:outer membrane protein assembly factor BamB